LKKFLHDSIPRHFGRLIVGSYFMAVEVFKYWVLNKNYARVISFLVRLLSNNAPLIHKISPPKRVYLLVV
jgi:hypothetical protein